MQRLFASVLLAAGVWVLAGVGWALVAAGVLVWVADDRSVMWLTERRDAVATWVRESWTLVAGVPRRSLAGASMAAGLVAVPVGAVVVAGVGVGLLALGGLLIAFSLLSGWGA